MSAFAACPYDPVIVRAGDAEHLPEIGHHLLADASASDGALSAHRIRLARGTGGAVPHRHDHSSELFFVVDGARTARGIGAHHRRLRRPPGRPADL